MTSTCPSCGCEQGAGLLCAAETDRLERDLGDVAAIVADLEVTLSKQARIGTAGTPGLARERTPIAVGAIDPTWVLGNVLTTWARDVAGDPLFCSVSPHPAVASSWLLLRNIPAIRRHPAVDELVDEITDAIRLARQTVDRPADRQYLGQCLVATPDEDGRHVTCLAEIYASPTAREVTCKVCGITHDVGERRNKMLDKAEEFLFTIREAAQIIGSYGDLRISESTIRSYVSNGELAYHGKVNGSSVILMGDLMKVIADHAAKPQGRKLRRVS